MFQPKTPQRTCIATGEILSQGQLLRFVAGPQGTAHLDITGKAPGRGAYLMASYSAWQQALKRKAFERALKTPAPVWEEVLASLTQSFLGRLGLARKAGQLVVGTDNVQEAWHQKKIGAVLMAQDAAPNTYKKVTAWGLPTVTLCTKSNYEQALGVANCTVIGVQTTHPAWETAQLLSGLMEKGERI